MTELSQPWAGLVTGDAGPYSDDDWSDMYAALFLGKREYDGVVKGYLNELAISGTASPLSIATGAAVVDGKYYKNDSAASVAIPTPSVSSRYDRIVLRKSWAAQTVRLTRIAGSEGSGVPALTQTDGATWDIPIAIVHITTGASITIIDDRSFARVSEDTAKNYILNPAMNIAQGTITSIANGAMLATTCWRYIKSGAMVHDASQDLDVPTLLESRYTGRYSLLLDVTTADGSIAAGDYCGIRNYIEGFDFQAIDGKLMTLSFWVKSSLTGTYCVAFENSGADFSYVCEYDIDSADTWEQKTVHVPINYYKSGVTDNYGNGTGLRITFTLAAGSTYQASSADAWEAGSFLATANQVNAVGNTSYEFNLAMVDFHIGPHARPFHCLTMEEELRRTLRYYWTTYEQRTALGAVDTDGAFSATSVTTATTVGVQFALRFPAPMRTDPTITTYSTATGASGKIRDVTGGADVNSQVTEDSQTGANVSNSAVVTANRKFLVHAVADAMLS